jgi:glycosyltransferase involved in cell wall biosynthesis
MLDIAVSYSHFANSHGGARESLLTLLEGASNSQKISVTVYQPAPADNHPQTNFDYQIQTKPLHSIPKLTWADRIITSFQWKKHLRKELKSTHDVLITQTDLAPVSVTVANEKGIPSIYFIRSLALTGYEKYFPERGHFRSFIQTDIGGKIQYPFLWENFQQHFEATNTATAVVANSEFTAEKLSELFRLKTHTDVIYPPIDPEKYRVEYNPDGEITMVNPRTEYKGPQIFMNIADELPEEDFLMVGDINSSKIKKRAERTENVTHWEWCNDMRKAYSKSKLVVVPSLVEESFGRVPAEAMISGIPCVVSDRGGLPEVVGDTGEIVSDINSTNAWLAAIKSAFKNHRPVQQKRHVRNFLSDRQIKKFNTLLNDVTSDEM